MAKYLVTGVAGFIGSHLTERLLAEGHELVGIDNMNAYYDVELKKARLERFKDKITFHQIDIENAAEVARIILETKPETIFHMAAQAGVRYSLENPYTYGATNAQGTLNVLEGAKRAGVMNVVLASSSSVYGENGKVPFAEADSVDGPVSIYAATKRATELFAFTYSHLYRMNIACLRFFTVYGPFGRPDMALFKFTEAILAGKPIDLYNNGDMKRDFTYISDIVDGVVRAGAKPDGYQIYNLGYGSPAPLMDFVTQIEESLGMKAQINSLPMQPGDVPITYADISKAKEKLGFSPTVSIQKGIPEFVKWYRTYYSA